MTALHGGVHHVTVTLTASSGVVTGGESLVASHVIAALPPRLLNAMVTFDPALAGETVARWRDTPTWMAPHAKFVALYDWPFWREAGLSGTAQSMGGPMAEIHDATTASGQAVLFGFVVVDAEPRAAVGEAVLTRACVEQLGRLFGEEARRPVATLLKDWAADPCTATSADQVPGCHPAGGEARWVTGPWERYLTPGGSEVSPLEPGYLVGAVLAAERGTAAAIAAVQAGHRG